MASNRSKSLRPLIIYALVISTLVFSLLFVLLSRHPEVIINDNSFRVELAIDDDERSRGLSSRQELADDEGMLFIFDQEFFYSFWMKEMQFDLDIYWINDDLKIVHIERNLSPDTYPQSFINNTPAKYVLELNGGSFLEYGINLGDTIKLKNI